MLNGEAFEVKIRPLAEGELELPERLARKIWPETYGTILSPQQIDYMIDMMYAPETVGEELSNGTEFFLICRGDVPIGFLSLGAYPEGGSGVWKLHKLYLDFAWHGIGIGSLALRFAKKEAAEHGAKRFRLNVNKYNLVAQRAYSRNGFQKIGSVCIDIGNGFFMDDYVMEAVLE